MTQHVSHRHSDEVHELRADNERLKAENELLCQAPVNELWQDNVNLEAEVKTLRAALTACVRGSKDWMEKAKAALAGKEGIDDRQVAVPSVSRKGSDDASR